MSSRGLVFAMIVLGLAACASQPLAPPAPDTALMAAIASPVRTESHRSRDPYRHPFETLSFFGIKPEMTVVEVWPSGGWYTEILAPYLRDKGRYVAAGFVVDTPDASNYFKKVQAKFAAKLAESPALYDRVVVSPLGKPDHYVPVSAGTADMVLTFRNVHNWMTAGNEHEMFKAFFAALKPGGILGVVEHRAAPDSSRAQMQDSGYVAEELVYQLATDAGFQLVSASEINANPADTKDYPEGVWTLPPTFTLGDKDRARYAAIGESDRMTLKFIKPLP